MWWTHYHWCIPLSPWCIRRPPPWSQILRCPGPLGNLFWTRCQRQCVHSVDPGRRWQCWAQQHRCIRSSPRMAFVVLVIWMKSSMAAVHINVCLHTLHWYVMSLSLVLSVELFKGILCIRSMKDKKLQYTVHEARAGAKKPTNSCCMLHELAWVGIISQASSTPIDIHLVCWGRGGGLGNVLVTTRGIFGIFRARNGGLLYIASPIVTCLMEGGNNTETPLGPVHTCLNVRACQLVTGTSSRYQTCAKNEGKHTASVAAAYGPWTFCYPPAFSSPSCFSLLPVLTPHPHRTKMTNMQNAAVHNLIWLPHTGTGLARASRGVQAEKPKAPTFNSLIGACPIPPLHSASCGVRRRISQLPRAHSIGPLTWARGGEGVLAPRWG